MDKVRTRFAPSPTGFMHIGNLRTGLYAYLFAKKNGGDFVLRIEDTDQARYVDGAVQVIYNTLKTAGIDYDEGPDKDKGFGPYIQSERKKLKLITSNGVIICYHKFSDAVTNEMKNDMVVVKRGLAVNINHIVDTDFETVVLSNGTKLKISDGYRNSVMDVLSDKIGGA